jgi:hypothetical protein
MRLPEPEPLDSGAIRGRAAAAPAQRAITYVGTPDASGDIYSGLDRFGRVIDQRWVQGPGGVDQDRFKYRYDAKGNRLYKENTLIALTRCGRLPLNRSEDTVSTYSN